MRLSCLQPLHSDMCVSNFANTIVALSALPSATNFMSSCPNRPCSLHRRRRPPIPNLMSSRPCSRPLNLHSRTPSHYHPRSSLPNFTSPRSIIHRIRSTLQCPIIRLSKRSPVFFIPRRATVGLRELVACTIISAFFSILDGGMLSRTAQVTYFGTPKSFVTGAYGDLAGAGKPFASWEGC
jgi:hypothetical protein